MSANSRTGERDFASFVREKGMKGHVTIAMIKERVRVWPSMQSIHIKYSQLHIAYLLGGGVNS